MKIEPGQEPGINRREGDVCPRLAFLGVGRVSTEVEGKSEIPKSNNQLSEDDVDFGEYQRLHVGLIYRRRLMLKVTAIFWHRKNGKHRRKSDQLRHALNFYPEWGGSGQASMRPRRHEGGTNLSGLNAVEARK